LSAVGIDYDNSNLDGMNVWDTIKSGTVSDEQEDREIVLYLNPNECNLEVCGAMYWQNFKFVYTNVGTTTNDDSSSCYWKDQFASKKDSSVLGCTGLQSNSDVSCDCATTACLFDLSSDPCETINVFNDYPNVAEYMKALLQAYGEAQFDSLNDYCDADWTKSSPSLFDNYWSPFLDSSENCRFESELANWKSDESSDETKSNYWSAAQTFKDQAKEEISENIKTDDKKRFSFKSLVKNISSYGAEYGVSYGISFGVVVLLLAAISLVAYFIYHRHLNNKDYKYIALSDDDTKKKNLRKENYGTIGNM
jgi:hypothetical protein